MFESGQKGGAGAGGGRTPGRVLADRIVARDTRIRAEELGTVLDLQAWLGLHSVDPTDPFAKGIAGGAGRRAGSDGTPLVDEFAVREYAALRHQSEPTARAFMIDVADLEHRFPKLWAAVQALWLPVWQARKIVAACRELSKEAAALVDVGDGRCGGRAAVEPDPHPVGGVDHDRRSGPGREETAAGEVRPGSCSCAAPRTASTP